MKLIQNPDMLMSCVGAFTRLCGGQTKAVNRLNDLRNFRDVDIDQLSTAEFFALMEFKVEINCLNDKPNPQTGDILACVKENAPQMGDFRLADMVQVVNRAYAIAEFRLPDYFAVVAANSTRTSSVNSACRACIKQGLMTKTATGFQWSAGATVQPAKGDLLQTVESTFCEIVKQGGKISRNGAKNELVVKLNDGEFRYSLTAKK